MGGGASRTEGTAASAAVDYVELMLRARRDEDMIAYAARCVLQAFDAYYVESRAIPAQAKQAFEARDPARSLELSRRRLSIYSDSIRELAGRLTRVYPLLAHDEATWQKVEAQYLPLIRGRYEEDLALAFLQSTRRIIFQDEWTPVDYSFGGSARSGGEPVYIHRDYPGGAVLAAGTVAEILRGAGFAVPFRDLSGDAGRVAARVNRQLGFDGRDPQVIRVVRMIDAGFFRNRGAYLVGCIVLRELAQLPLVISLENGPEGLFVDAVLTDEADCHNIFSSTLANFHVTDSHYHELAAFLFAIMPRRALGLHYSTIGFNHVGKVAVMDELRDELERCGELFGTAVGFRGSVAIGFSAPSSRYTLKVIRDRPTAQYKWGRFEGVESVLAKYRRVHEINRTGSMLDNIIYANLRLDPGWFEPALLEELLEAAAGCVSLKRGVLSFRHLIAQPKLIPLPVYLETASPAEAADAMVNLGHCIKNNAAADIFNKDLDARNYGVSQFRKVYLFDYDALEPFTEVKVRTNLDRVDGEEEVPGWVFEDGVVFLPEELEAGLGIDDRMLRRLFRRVHGDLLGTAYWERLQAALRDGKVPRISIYPDACKLPRNEDGPEPAA